MKPLPRQSHQTGIALIEAMLAIVIFSLGVLGIIGLQATSLKFVSDAKYRVDASNLTDQLISQMWVDNHSTSALISKYASATGSSATGYETWKATVAATLPGASSNPPTVTITADSEDSKRSNITVVVFWKAPGNNSSLHNYSTVTTIR